MSAVRPVRDLDPSALPCVDPRASAALNRLYACVPPIDFALRGQPTQLRLRQPRWPAAAASPPAAFAFRLGTHRGCLWLDDRALALLLGDPHAAALPHELSTILLADALQPLVERAAAASGMAFEWLADASTPAAGVADALWFELRPDHAAPGVVGSLVFDDSAAWADATARIAPPGARPLPSTLLDLPIPLRLEIGRVSLRLGELRGITRGDIVAIEPWAMDGASLGVRACVGRHAPSAPSAPAGHAVRPAFCAVARGTTLTVLSSGDPLMTTSAEPMNKSAVGDALDPPLESLEGLEVSVRFEAGQLQLPLRELGLVKPGHVFDLGQPLTHSVVRIVAHGSVVGTGQLVAIGERLGVRVTEFASGDV